MFAFNMMALYFLPHIQSRREDRRLFKKRLRAATKIGNEAEVLVSVLYGQKKMT